VGFARDVGHITWTFDPLVARNAHVNLRCSARVTEYLVDQYGPMDDLVNRGDESDRLMVSGAAPRHPSPPSARSSSVAVPHDIEALRRTDPAEALEWRYRVRDAFGGLSEDGFVVIGFDERGYLFGRRP
jgi:predicted GNAT superfamily acetyltransferase